MEGFKEAAVAAAGDATRESDSWQCGDAVHAVPLPHGCLAQRLLPSFLYRYLAAAQLPASNVTVLVWFLQPDRCLTGALLRGFRCQVLGFRLLPQASPRLLRSFSSVRPQPPPPLLPDPCARKSATFRPPRLYLAITLNPVAMGCLETPE